MAEREYRRSGRSWSNQACSTWRSRLTCRRWDAAAEGRGGGETRRQSGAAAVRRGGGEARRRRDAAAVRRGGGEARRRCDAAAERRGTPNTGKATDLVYLSSRVREVTRGGIFRG